MTLQEVSGILSVSTGVTVFGSSVINGTLSGLTGLTVASGGASITGGSGMTALTVNNAIGSGARTIVASGGVNPQVGVEGAGALQISIH